MTWVNSNGRAFGFLPPAQEPENGKGSAGKGKGSNPEILPPEPSQPARNGVALPPLDAALTATLDLSYFERQLREAAKMLDLERPEGWLDSWFGRMDHRIEVKTERAERLADYIRAGAAILTQARSVIEEAGALQRTKYQLVVDRVVELNALLQAQYQVEFAHRQAQRQDAIEDAKAKEIIAECEAKIREHSLRGRPQPPPPPPPPPEDPRVKNKARLQQDIERLNREEAEAIQKITGGKPEHEWSDGAREEVVRTQNMYHDAREERREELRRFL